MKNIRNFSVIAHIDHGKSTLSDRLIEYCGGLSAREMSEQILDSMDIERERGITIKAQAVTLEYTKDNTTYQLNFIDTPGHVDFSYEVSRSLSACEGALLVVDGSQGVEAQTLANCYTAVDQDLEVVPVINKIDLPQAEPERVKKEIEDMELLTFELTKTRKKEISEKTGLTLRTIQRIENNEVKPSLHSLRVLGEALQTDLTEVGKLSVAKPYEFNFTIKITDMNKRKAKCTTCGYAVCTKCKKKYHGRGDCEKALDKAVEEWAKDKQV